ncbi:MAG: hypothetical protein J6U43_06625, partial [Bacteroidales bacterium]|nr:hypothetical protein [Bacteroidales bacterium]
QFIIDAFQPQEEIEPKAIDLRINSAMIRRSRVSYHVLSEPHLPDSCFDINHIDISNLSTTINIRALNRDSLNVHIKRLSCKEHSGININRLSLQARANTHQVHLSDFVLQLPGTRIEPHIEAEYANIENLAQLLDSAHMHVNIENAKVTLSDIAAFVPSFYKFNTPITLSCKADGRLNDFTAHHVNIDMGGKAIVLNVEGSIQNILNLKNLNIGNGNIQLQTRQNGPLLIKQNLDINDSIVNEILHNAGAVNLNSNISGTVPNIKARLSLRSGIGDLATQLAFSGDSSLMRLSCNGRIESKGIDVKKILGSTSPVGIVAIDANINGRTYNHKVTKAGFNGKVNRIDFNQYSYNNIGINAALNNDCYSGKIEFTDPNGDISIDGFVDFSNPDTHANVEIECADIDLAAFNLVPQAIGNKLSFDLNATYNGKQLDKANGYVHISDIFYGNKEENFKWDRLNIDALYTAEQQQIAITSDYINGKIVGEYTFETLVQSVSDILSQFAPSVIPTATTHIAGKEATADNNFDWDFTIKPHLKMAQLLKFPITLTDNAHIEGFVDESEQSLQLKVAIPNMWAGLTHLEKFNINLENKGPELQHMTQTNLVDAQQKATTIALNGSAESDSLLLSLNWDAHSQPLYNGNIKLGSKITKRTNDSLDIAINIHPTNFIINDTVWDIKPASVAIKEHLIEANNIEISRPSQHITIDGRVSRNPQDTLHVDLQDINLDYIFKTLNIDFVTFAGHATGRIDVADIYGQSPYICTRKLDIRNFSYNDAIFGDLSLFSQLETDEMGILLKGIITNKNKKDSYVDGYIFPTKDSLSIAFDVAEAPLKFIRPFLNSILIDADGIASGHVVLEGSFERIYVYGDAFAHEFSFGVPFINTRYHLSDSIHFTKDRIFFDDVTVYDIHNHSAKGRGSIKHKYFTQTEYNIDIYDADRVLVFDVPRTVGIPYYGTIFGSGNVNVSGNDFNTNIAVNMTPTRNSNFTFVLSNTTNAVDYPFLTFSNKRENVVKQDTYISEIDSFVMNNNMLMERKKVTSSIQNILDLSITADINPDSEINIVMNEITGDKMQAYGEGVMRLNYNTA